MWILNWLPNWLFYLITFVGVIGLVATYFIRFIPIPTIYLYKTPIQLVSIFLICFGVFMSGAVYNNDKWLARVKELEEKIEKAEQQSKEATTKIEEKTEKVRTKIVEKEVLLKQYVDREIVKYNNQCEIPKEFVDVVNKAAEPPK